MKKLICLLLAGLLFFTCSSREEKPRLIVFISVDQLVPDLLDKYDPLFKGGYHWFRQHGENYANTYHEHGYTTTGAGHFVLASGQYPGPHGIIGNNWYDRKLRKSVYAVEDSLAQMFDGTDTGKSYRQINSTALGDWLKSADPKAKVFSVALKDRAAIMLGGKNPDLVLWYNWKGAFTTSDYYAQTLPGWVQTFNKNLNLLSYRDSVWNHILPLETYDQYARPDSFPGEIDRHKDDYYNPVLPFFFDSTYSDEKLLDGIGGTPWGDRITLQLAQACIRKNRLGKDRVPDIMFISLSANDWIGHDFGPFSQEMMDNLLRTDRALMKLITFVEAYVGKGRTVYVLTADHGSGPIPEYARLQGRDSGRINRPEIKSRAKAARDEIESKYGSNLAVSYGQFVYYNDALLKQRNIPKQVLTDIFRKHLNGVQGLAAIMTKDELLAGIDTTVIAERMRHMLHPVNSPDLWLLNKKYWTFRYPLGSTHGSPYDYDSHVPLYFARALWISTIVNDQKATIDIAPALARLLEVGYPEQVDGTPFEINP
ncbi:MAG: alkaline phosphatase family protein [Fidelibacterota bacterium]